MIYQDELLTAEEKAAYYEDLIKNNGQENGKNISKDCMKKAGVLLKKVDDLDEDESQPLRDKIAGLVSLAKDYNAPTPPDVLASQRSDDDEGQKFPLTKDLENSLAELGLSGFRPARDSDADAKTDADANESKEINELRKKARFWKNIHAWSPAESFAYYFCGPVKPADWTEAMFVRAQKDPFAVKVLAQHGEINYLLELARMGNQEAAKKSIELLENLVRRLNLYAKTDPDAFKKAAAKLMSWPVMYSPHPLLNQNPEKVSGNIKIGADLLYLLEKGAKWDPRKPGTKIAMILYHYVDQMRQYPESNRSLPFADEASKLPDINTLGSVRKWWVVARNVLESAYNSPEYEIETVREAAENRKILETFSKDPAQLSESQSEFILGRKKPELIDDINLIRLTKIQNRKKMRAKILEIIQNSFMSLFPDQAR